MIYRPACAMTRRRPNSDSWGNHSRMRNNPSSPGEGTTTNPRANTRCRSHQPDWRLMGNSIPEGYDPRSAMITELHNE